MRLQGYSSRSLIRRARREFPRVLHQGSPRQVRGDFSRQANDRRREDPEPGEGVSYRVGEQAFSCSFNHVQPRESRGQGWCGGRRPIGKESRRFARRFKPKRHPMAGVPRESRQTRSNLELRRAKTIYRLTCASAARFSATPVHGVIESTTYSLSLPSASGTRKSNLSL